MKQAVTIILMDDDFLALQMMSRKICHDLANPIGSLTLGLEVLEDSLEALLGERSPTALNTILPLLQECLQLARLHLEIGRFLVASGHEVNGYLVQAALTYLDKYAQTKDVCLDATAIEQLIGRRAQAGIALLLAGLDFLPRGGALALTATPQGFILRVQGGYIKDVPRVIGIKGLLNLPVTPRTIILWYAAKISIHERMEITIEAHPVMS